MKWDSLFKMLFFEKKHTNQNTCFANKCTSGLNISAHPAFNHVWTRSNRWHLLQKGFNIRCSPCGECEVQSVHLVSDCSPCRAYTDAGKKIQPNNSWCPWVDYPTHTVMFCQLLFECTKGGAHPWPARNRICHWHMADDFEWPWSIVYRFQEGPGKFLQQVTIGVYSKWVICGQFVMSTTTPTRNGLLLQITSQNI